MTTPTIKDIRAAAAARKQRRERRRKLLVSAVVVIVVLGVGVFFGIPPVVEAQLKSRLELVLKRDVEVGQVTFDLLTLSTAFEDVRVRDHDGSEMITWSRLVMDGRLAGVISGAWSADAIELEGFTGRLVVDEKGALNVADILTDLLAGEEGARPFEVGQFSITDAQLRWTDTSRGQPFETTLGPVTFSLSNLHTKSDPNSPYEFEAVTESGESLIWDGTLSLSPFRSQGRWEMRGLRLSKYEPYLDKVSPLEFTSGEIDASGSYEIKWVEGALNYRLSGGQLAVDQLTAINGSDPDDQQLIGTLAMEGLEFDSTQRTLTIGRVRLGEGRVSVRRDSSGWSWMGIEFGDDSVPGNFADGLNLKTARVEELLFDHYNLHLNDHAARTPVDLRAQISHAAIGPLDLVRLSQKTPIVLDAELASGGMVMLRGEAAFQPFRSEFEFELSDIDMVEGAPYFEELTGANLASGELTARGQVIGMAGRYVLTGSGRIADLSMRDAQGNELFDARLAEASKFSVIQDPSAIRIETLALTSPRARLEILELGEWGFAKTGIPPTVAFQQSVERSWEIDTIDVADGEIAFRDGSAFRPVELSAGELEGVFTGWTSRDSRTAKVQLTGVLQGASSVTIAGGFNPLSDAVFADVKINARDLSASDFSGYLSRYLGYEISTGNVDLDIEAKLQDRMIESETITVIERAALGAKVASPDATQVPIEYALSLLRDAEERIIVEGLVVGRLDDPEFSFGRGYSGVFTEMFSRAVDSPFMNLGTGGVGQSMASQLQNYAFVAGGADLSGEGTQNLEKLGQLLADRPLLKLEVSAGYDPQEDRAELLPDALERELRRRATAASFDGAGNWNSSLRIKALVELYQETFNELPIDPDGELPPAKAPVSVETVPEVETRAEQENRSLMAWLRRLFVAPEKATNPESSGEVVSAPPPMGSFPAPEGLRKELAILPVEQIVNRLLPEQTVTDAQFRDLGRARVEAVRMHLQQAGIDPSRLMLGDIEAGPAMVTLSLL